MANPVLYVASNPSDGIATYQKVRIQRAPDSSGVPGAYSNVVLLDIDSSNENTNYTDTGGVASTDWYHHRWETTDGLTVSAYSAALQAGDYLIRQWVKSDIPDADITNTMWDYWRDQAIQDLSFEQVARPADTQSLTATGNTTDQWYSLNAGIRIVTRVDMYSGNDYVGWTDQWEQRGRQLRLFFPDSALTYKVYGIGEIRNLGDLDDELFMLVYWMVRRAYLDFRIAQRANWKNFQVAERPDDTSTPALVNLRAIASAEVQARLEKARKVYVMPARGM